MINIFDYEYKNVIVKCIDGRVYQGYVKWCARAVDIDEEDDMLAIGGTGILANEIESIKILNLSETDKENRTA